MKRIWLHFAMGILALAQPILAQEEVDDPFSLPETSGQGSPFGKPKKATVAVSLVSEATVVEAGKPFTIGLKMVHGGKLHTYWVNPGSSGIATSIAWTLPEGFTASPIIWGIPHALKQFDEYSHVYEGTVVHLINITPPDSFTSGAEVELKGDVAGQQCDEFCYPLKASLSIRIKAGPQTEYDAAIKASFDKVRAEQPKASPSWEAAASEDGFTVTLTSKEGATSDPGDVYFFDANLATKAGPPTVVKEQGKIIVSLTKKEGATKKPGGMLVATNGWDQAGRKALAIGEVIAPPAISAGPKVENPTTPPVVLAEAADLEPGYVELGGMEPEKPNIWLALLWALIGGALLNLMPCVFPVLGLKVLSFVKMGGENPRKVLMHGLAFAAGVVAFVWILAALVIIAKSSAPGGAVTWGFQLRSPWFMAFIIALLFGIGLNLSGVFEVGTSLTQLGGVTQGNKGYLGSFLSGALTTLVATPCTGPFMAGAIGWAFSQTNVVIFLILTVLGLGIALPYVILSASPPLLKLLPKPGAWMETFKNLMAFPAYAAAVYFLNAFGQLCGLGSASWLLFALVLLALALYAYGRWCTPYRTAPVKLFGALAALALVGWGGVITRDAIRDGVAEVVGSGGFWEKWTPEREIQARREGKIIFLDHTTTACAICDANERDVFHASGSEVVKARFKQLGVVALKAHDDGLDPNVPVGVKRFDRSGYPVNIVFPGKYKAIRLPTRLNQALVLQALDEAAARLKAK